MNFRAVVSSDRTEDRVATTLQEAYDLALMLSEEFGYVDVVPNQCGPNPIIATFNNGRIA